MTVRKPRAAGNREALQTDGTGAPVAAPPLALAAERQYRLPHMIQTGLVVLLIALLCPLGCSKGRKGSETAEAGMADQSAQKVTSPSQADRQRLHDQRAVVERYLADESSKAKYQTAAGKLGTIRAILAGNVFRRSQTYELQCLGIVLGDAFVEDLRMEWVMVEDAHGRDPAVRLPGTSIILFPLTMISKRIERGEVVDVFDLYNGVAAEVEAARHRGG